MTVQAQPDLDAGNEVVTLSHAISTASVSSGYLTTLSIAAVTVTVDDDDTPGLVVAPQQVAVTEEHATLGSATYTVRLATLPGGAVTVSLTPSPAGAVTFTTSSWQTAQAVTATAQNDGNTDNKTVTLSHAVAAVSTDTEYNYGVRVAEQVTVSVTDNATPNLSLSAGGLTGDGVREGAAEAYTVALTTQPAQSGTVRVAAGHATGASGGQAAGANVTLTYSGTSWDTAQTVTVSAETDADAVDGDVVLTHAASGADYARWRPCG